MDSKEVNMKNCLNRPNLVITCKYLRIICFCTSETPIFNVIGNPQPRFCLSYTLCILMNSSIRPDTISQAWFIVHTKGSQVRILEIEDLT